MPRPKHAREAGPEDGPVQKPRRSTPSSTSQVIYGDHSSTYWPPGWNFKRFTEASPSDLAALPEKEMEKTRARIREALGDHGADMLVKHLYEEGRKKTMSSEDIAAEQASRSPPDFVITYRQRVKEGAWGFAAVRSACYDDEEKREKFKKKWEGIVNIGFRRNDGVEGVENLESKDLDGADYEVLREKYNAVYPSLPWELQQSFFLSVTDKVIDSVLENEEPTIESRLWREDAPIVIVEAKKGYPVLQEGEESGGIPRSFKVALEMLVGEFWPLVAADTGTLGNSTRFLREDEIWWSTSPSPARVRKRMKLRERLDLD